MKKLVALIILVIILVGCSSSDQKILEAIELTEAAKPTDTSTPFPTNTNTPTSTFTLTPTLTLSPTPDVPHIQGFSREDILQVFLKNGFTCGDWELNDKGNFEQSCLSSSMTGIPDSTIMGMISGRSEDTVYGYALIFTPHTTFDSWDDLEIILKDLVYYGKDPEENITWIDDCFSRIKDLDEFVENKKYYDTDLILTSEKSVVSLLVISSR